MDELFAIEREVNGRPAAEQLAVRRERSAPIVAALEGWSRTPELEAALGARIRAVCVDARMSQGDLGAAVGITFQQIQKHENGKDRVAASTLRGLAAALGVHPGSFFYDDMPVPVGSISVVNAAMRAAEVLQQIRDPRVLEQFIALVRELAMLTASGEQPVSAPEEAP